MGRKLMELKVQLEKQKVQNSAGFQFFLWDCVFISLDFSLALWGWVWGIYSGKMFLYQTSSEVLIDKVID